MSSATKAHLIALHLLLFSEQWQCPTTIHGSARHPQRPHIALGGVPLILADLWGRRQHLARDLEGGGRTSQ